MRVGIQAGLAVWLLTAPSVSAQTTHAFRGELLEAVVRFGFSTLTPIGLEITNWTELGREVDVAWRLDAPACSELERILAASSTLRVEETGGHCLVWPSAGRPNVLDTVIDDFRFNRANLVLFDSLLHLWLESALDPEPAEGVVGSLYVPEGTPSVGPFALEPMRAREILSTVAAATPGGALWLADGSLATEARLPSRIWRIVSYRQDRGLAVRSLKEFVQARRRGLVETP